MRDRNTFAKRQRETGKRQKAAEKRERREKRRESADDPQASTNTLPDDPSNDPPANEHEELR